LTSVTYPGSQVRTYHYNESAHTGGSNLLEFPRFSGQLT